MILLFYIIYIMRKRNKSEMADYYGFILNFEILAPTLSWRQ